MWRLGILSLVFAQGLPVRSWAEIEAHLQAHPETLYVLNFWATWCRPCVAELPHLQAAYEQLRDTLPVQIWLISLDFPPAGASQAAALLQRKGISLPAFWLNEKDPNTWIPRLNPAWDGAIPYTQAGLSGPFHGAFPDAETVRNFVIHSYAETRKPNR